MKKKIVLTTILLLIIICLITSVNAETKNSFKAEAKATAETLKPGEEVTISINVSDINIGTDGINVLEGKINYDRNIFEEIKRKRYTNL